jgi:DNA primase catalytic subunit
MSKAILTRTRLEALCRELQRQHKAMKDEMSIKSREDEEKRKEVANGFQAKLAEISALIEENHTRNDKLKEQNTEIRDRLNEVVDRYAAREEEVKKLLKTADEQSKLAEARINNMEKENLQYRILHLKEKEAWTNVSQNALLRYE